MSNPKRYFCAKYEGDDLYSWAVFDRQQGEPILTGESQRSARSECNRLNSKEKAVSKVVEPVVPSSKIEFSIDLISATNSTVGYLANDGHGFKITFEDAWDAGRMSMNGFEKEDKELDVLIEQNGYKAVCAAWKRRKK